MALNYCTGCTTAYALSLDACPHCRQPAQATATEVQAEPRRARRKPTAEPEPEAGDDRG